MTQRRRNNGKQIVALVAFLALTFSAAGIGSYATTPNIAAWCAGLAKASWTPPGWLFGPVWTLLYVSMAVAAWLVWRQGGRWPLALFAVQLAMNAAWSWFFFGFHAPGSAFIEVVVLFVAIVATTIAFWPKSIAAGILMLPYLGWVTFAAVLNLAIWRLNG